MAATSWITPVSLFASMTDTIPVGSFNAAATSSRSTTPSRFTASLRSFQPLRASSCAGLATHGCSIALTAICAGLRNPAAPLMNRLLASVPPETKTICDGCTLTSAATCSRATLTALRACVPSSCRLDALPYCCLMYGSIASSTRSSSGVVALWSR
jgi:hypothetical protein